MFSGIVEEQGVIERVDEKNNLIVLTLKASQVLKGAKVGDSIAINGVCLTVTALKPGRATFDVMKETMRATTLGTVKPGTKVNLERALKVNDRLGGHFVSGHVDGLGTIKQIVTLENYVEFRLSVPKPLARYIAPKGSVALDGISLTIGPVRGTVFSVYLIPHTLKVTTFGAKKAGDPVNVETDMLAKYILRDRDISADATAKKGRA